MTDPTDMHREPQPPNDGVDGEPQSQQRQSPAEPDQPDAKLDQTPDDTPAQGDPISDAAALTEECLDWRAFTGNTAEELEREFAVLQVSADALGEESWKCRMRVMIRARAYKRIVGGSKFEAACRKHLHIGKDTAHRIIKWLFAEPKIIREIWDRVLAEAHSARINKNNYIYPSYNKMIKCTRNRMTPMTTATAPMLMTPLTTRATTSAAGRRF